MPRSARTCEAATTRSGPGGRGDHRYRHAGRLLGGQGGPAGERTLARSIEELYDEWEREARRVAVTVGEARAELVRAERQIHLDGIMREGSRNVSLGLGVVGGVGASTVLGRTAIRGARTVRATRRLSTLEGRWTTAASFYDERRLARRERRLMMREANRPLKRPIRQGRSAVRRERHALRTQRSLTSAGRALQTSARYTRFVRGVGVVGVVGNTIGIVDAARHGDVERVATGTAAVAGSALMFTPAAPVGAALVVGSMVYEHRDTITRSARRARDWAGRKISNGVARLNPFGG